MTYFEQLIVRLRRADEPQRHPERLDDEVELLVQKAYMQGHVDGRKSTTNGLTSSHTFEVFICGVRAGGLYPFGKRG